jgi:hypothetical protein
MPDFRLVLRDPVPFVSSVTMSRGIWSRPTGIRSCPAGMWLRPAGYGMSQRDAGRPEGAGMSRWDAHLKIDPPH